MKTPIKILMLLLSCNLLTGCASLLDEKLQAKVDALCPATISTSDYDIPAGEDSILKNTKAANENEENEFFISYRVGVGTELPINNKFSFEPALLLASKGNKATFNGFEDKLTSTYIDVPLVINYQLGESNFRLNGGLQPSVLLSAKRIIKGSGNENSQKVTDQFNTFDLAATIGAGYQFENGFGLHFGYDHGFININKTKDGFGTGFKAYNRVLRLGLSYTFSRNK